MDFDRSHPKALAGIGTRSAPGDLSPDLPDIPLITATLPPAPPQEGGIPFTVEVRVLEGPRSGPAQPAESLTPFDPEAWEAARNRVIAASRSRGNVHLDRIPMAVEPMRGREIIYVHDPAERGRITTVTNRGQIYVRWAGGPMKGSEAFITERDRKDYAIDRFIPVEPPGKLAPQGLSKRAYLNHCLEQPVSWLTSAANNPSPGMRPIHVALCRIAIRRKVGGRGLK